MVNDISMDAVQMLTRRVSASRLSGPAPDEQSLQNIYRAAMRAADHAMLRPWRFLVIEGEARERLGDLFAKASMIENPEMPEKKLESIRDKALRAPVIIVTISSPVPHPGVPVFEQEWSAAAAVQNMLNAAYAQGLGAIWRTGSLSQDRTVMQGLGLSGAERIIGFLYLGQLDTEPRAPRDLPTDEYFRRW